LSRRPEEIADSACRLIAAFELSTEGWPEAPHDPTNVLLVIASLELLVFVERFWPFCFGIAYRAFERPEFMTINCSTSWRNVLFRPRGWFKPAVEPQYQLDLERFRQSIMRFRKSSAFVITSLDRNKSGCISLVA
jgi:hypothetical protein